MRPVALPDVAPSSPSARPRNAGAIRRDLLLVLLTIVVTTLFWRAAPVRPAYAQLPDAGAQRAAILQELRASNSKLTEITSLLKQIRDQTKPKSEKPEPHKSRP